MSGRLTGHTAFVTAAAQGMGRGIAEALARAGARVVATDANVEQLASLQSEHIEVRALDVRDGAQIRALAREFDNVDILANIAGYVHSGDILHCSDEDWDKSFDINVKAMFRCTQAFLPAMIRLGGGSIINMASVQSSVIGHTTRLAYGASKGAVIGLTKSVAIGHAHQGIRCNAICPGVIDTPTVQARVAATPNPEAERRSREEDHPIGRYGRPDEIGALCVYLASDEAASTTGTVVVIDGGYTLGPRNF